jgi:hypothetical protein
MGYSSYSDDHYTSRATYRAVNNIATFKHDDDVKKGKVAPGVHDLLNIHGKIRESRDSKEHPESTPIAVIFDETGSMMEVPKIMQAKLPALMGLLLRKGYIKDPQILFGAIGDWTCGERAPLQIGQFESGIEMDDAITNIYLEGGGGGQNTESYQNALYYLAHRTSCDAYEKRGKNGYAFLIGDECAYPKATKEELTQLIGDGAEGDVSLEAIVEAVKQKWEVFFIIPGNTSHFGAKWLKDYWSKLFGQNVIELKDPNAICEVIGSTIGIYEGTAAADSLAKDLKENGATDAIVATAMASVDPIAKNVALARVGTGGDLAASTGPSAATERL